MQWLFTTIQSGLGLLFSSRHRARLGPGEEKQVTEEIRAGMLAMLESVRDAPSALTVAARIRFAPDGQGLWFLRGEVMRLLAARHGESRAREQLAELKDLFDELLPGGLRSRPSPLGAAGDDSIHAGHP